MKYYTETISADLAEKLKEKGMPMSLWQQGGYDFIEVLEKRQEIFDDSTYEVAVRYEVPLYCEVFDWLMERGLSTEVYGRGAGYDFVICKECNDCTRGTRKSKPNYDGPNDGGCWDTWHEAANAAIEKALTLI